MDFALIRTWISIFLWWISIFSRTQPKLDGTIQRLYTVILSQHFYEKVRLSESPAVLPNFAFFFGGGGGKKKFGANAPTLLPPPILHQVSANEYKANYILSNGQQFYSL